jgi:transposase-like protein
MSEPDPLDDVYAKYLAPEEAPPSPERDQEAEIMAQKSEKPCPKCGSENVDRSNGYMGEYKCNACGHAWQVGGKDSRV